MAEKHLVLGLVAHVDAGKTTLSEALLYAGGQLRKLGRVDHGDAFLDTDPQERERGITIFSKQAEVTWPGLRLTLLDTPGHVDFPLKRSAHFPSWTRPSSSSAAPTAFRGTRKRSGVFSGRIRYLSSFLSIRWISRESTAPLCWKA